MNASGNLLEVYNLKKYFTITGDSFFGKNIVKAVDDVSFAIKRGETLGLVGESGCGKTTAGRAVLRLVEPTSGKIVFDGATLFDSGGVPTVGGVGSRVPAGSGDQVPGGFGSPVPDGFGSQGPDGFGSPVPDGFGSQGSDGFSNQGPDGFGSPAMSAGGSEAKQKRIKKKSVKMLPYRRRMQIVFQDPYASLDPRMTVGDIVGEGIDIHHLAASKKDRQDRIVNLLAQVGLNTEHANRYPHEFSGGQRQRVGIARALAVEPELIICDEPVSALDVSIQAQVMNMLEDLQEQIGLTYLFIAHDLSVVKHISNRIGVMYLGKLVELADSIELVFHCEHPYSKSLISAIPIADPITSRSTGRIVLEGDIPSPVNPPSGCHFRTRCSRAVKLCGEFEPELREISPGHFAACHCI
jgi:oligopeptide transport system ATP-binding protein